jgi:hypothetical protein
MRQKRRIRGVRAQRDCVVILPHPTFLWASESSSSFLLCTSTSVYPRWSSQEDSAIRNSSSSFTIARSLARSLARTCVYSHHFCVQGAVVHACHYVPRFVSLPISPGQKMVTKQFWKSNALRRGPLIFFWGKTRNWILFCFCFCPCSQCVPTRFPTGFTSSQVAQCQ